MTLTPLDIHNKEFSRSFRGYNREEVNEFLDRIVKDYESIIKKNIELKEEVEKLNSKLEHYQKMEETLHNAIIVAQETAEEVKESARKEAEVKKKEADTEANRRLEEANNEVVKSRYELEKLRKHILAQKTHFKSILNTQLELLESEEWLDEKPAALNLSEEDKDKDIAKEQDEQEEKKDEKEEKEMTTSQTETDSLDAEDYHEGAITTGEGENQDEEDWKKWEGNEGNNEKAEE